MFVEVFSALFPVLVNILDNIRVMEMRDDMRAVKSVQKKNFFLSLYLVSGVFLLALLGIDFVIRPAAETITRHQIKVNAMRIINDAMSSELQEDPVAYEDLVIVLQNREGNVTSIQSDMVGINLLKSRMTARIIDELLRPGNSSVHIRLGTLAGSHFFAGRGPEIEIRLMPVGHMTAQIYNEFTSAGINQTLHRIVLEVGLEIDAVFPGYRVKTETATSYVIAETVVVGNIPEGYIQITGLDISTLAA